MTDSFRLQIMKFWVSEISDRVDDVTDATFFGRYRYGKNDPLPMASLLEDPRIQEVSEADEHLGASDGNWRLLLQGFVQDGDDSPTGPAYQLVAKLQEACAAIRAEAANDATHLLSPERKVNRVESIEIGKPIVRPADEFSETAYCWLPLTLELIEDPASPFT